MFINRDELNIIWYVLELFLYAAIKKKKVTIFIDLA